MQMSPKTGGIIAGIVVGLFFAVFNYQETKSLYKALYPALIGLSLGLTTGYAILKGIDNRKCPKERLRIRFDLFMRISTSITGIMGGFLGKFVAEKFYVDNTPKVMLWAFVLGSIFMLINFAVWKRFEKTYLGE